MEAQEVVVQPKAPPRPVQRRLPEGPGRGDTSAPGETLHPLQLEGVELREREPDIRPRHPVVVLPVHFVGVHQTHGGLPAEIAPKTHHVVDRVVDAAGRQRRVVHPGYHPDIGPRELAGEFRRSNGIDDAPGVDQLVRRQERLVPGHEEWPGLGKEHRGSWIVGDLLYVGFDLREIRVHRAVERQVVGDPPAQVAAELGARRVVRPAVRLRRAGHLAGRLGVGFEHQPA